MCEACGPVDHNGKHVDERIRPELMAELRKFAEKEAALRGLTIDEYLQATTPQEKGRSWFESFWLNLRLLRPGL